MSGSVASTLARPHGAGPRTARARGRLALGVVLLAALALASGPAAAAPITVPLPGPLPPVRLLTVLVALHLIGVCFGLGGATMLDFWILRWMRWGGLPAEIARMFLFVGKVCTVGLVLLWLSGLGFLAIYALESPEKLQNPKLWAKITVVVVLTLNGLLIHSAVLPGVLRDVSRPMLQGISGRRTGVFLVSGAVSGVSWYTAFALGLLREFNGTVGYGVLIGLWLAGVAAASLGAYTLWLHLREWSIGQRAPFREDDPRPLPAEPVRGEGPQAEPFPGRHLPIGARIPEAPGADSGGRAFADIPAFGGIPASQIVRVRAGAMGRA